jgi:predicted DNA-binding transcriptional regulator YafY
MRLFAIARDLAAAPQGLLLDDLALRHGVARRTLERDLAGLIAVAHQIDSVPDEQSARQRKRLVGAARLGVHVSVAELAAARAAGRALAAIAAGPITASFGILLEKLEQAQSAAVRVDAAALTVAQAVVHQPGPNPGGDAAMLAILQEAILACAELRITYRKRDGEAAHDYIAHPCGLLFGGRNYLVWRGKDGGYRKFTLGNIVDAEPTGAHFTLDNDFSMEDFAARGIGVMHEASMEVELRVASSHAARLRDFRFHASQTLTPQQDGGLLIRFRAAGLEEICNAIFGCGSPIAVLAPAALASAYRARLHQALDMFAD